MTQDEIIEIAKRAGIPTGSRFVGGEVVECLTLEVEAFAKLVAAKEREACAKVCDDIHAEHEAKDVFSSYAEAIRARGEA